MIIPFTKCICKCICTCICTCLLARTWQNSNQVSVFPFIWKNNPPREKRRKPIYCDSVRNFRYTSSSMEDLFVFCLRLFAENYIKKQNCVYTDQRYIKWPSHDEFDLIKNFGNYLQLLYQFPLWHDHTSFNIKWKTAMFDIDSELLYLRNTYKVLC